MESKEIKKSLTSQIATGTMFTTVALLMNRASGMVLQMILVRMITVDQFGLFKLAIELSSFGIMFVTFFVGGVSASSTTRVVSLHMSSLRKDRIRSTIEASVLSVAVMSILLFSLTFFLMPTVLERIFKIRADLLPEAIPFFRWFLLYIFLSSIGMVSSAALRSSEFFKAYAITESITNLLRVLLIPVLLYQGCGLNGIVWGWAAALLVGIIPGLWILERFTNPRRTDLNLSSSMLPDMRDMTAFGIPVFLSTLSSTVYYSADTIILGYYMPVKFVAIYSAGVVLVHSLLYLFSGLETALFPILSSSLEKNKGGQESRILERGYRLLCIVTFPTAVYSFIMAPYMVRFLFGPDYLEAATPARILAILILAWAAMPAGVLFMSTGKPEINARIGVVSAVLNLVLNFSLIPSLGIMGAALSSAISRTYNSLGSVRMARMLFGASFPWPYAGRVLILSCLCAGPTISVFWLWPVTGSFLQTAIVLTLTGFIYSVIFGFLITRVPVLDEEDKRVLVGLLIKTPVKPLARFIKVN